MPDIEEVAPYRRVRVFIDLISQDGNGDDLPVEDQQWFPHIVFDHGEDDSESEFMREPAIDFNTLEDAFTWVFHELALAHLELSFEASNFMPLIAQRWRLPQLYPPTEPVIQQIFFQMWAMGDVEIEWAIGDGKSEETVKPMSLGWGAFIELTTQDGDDIYPSEDEPMIAAIGMPDVFALVLGTLERMLPSAPVSGASLSAQTLWHGPDYRTSLPSGEYELEYRTIATIFSNEDEIEEHLVHNPAQLYDNLVVIGQQLSLGDRTADIVALDATGYLVVVEIKYGSPDRRAIGQVVEYAAFLHAMDNVDLDYHLTSHGSLLAQDEGFKELYTRRHGRVPASGVPVRMALVATEADKHAARSVNYLRSSGLRLDFFQITALSSGDDTILSIERNPSLVLPKRWYPPSDLKGRKLANWIIAEAAETEAAHIHAEILQMVTSAFPSGRWVPRVDPDSLGLNWVIRGRNGKTAESITVRIYNHSPHMVWLMLFETVLGYAPRKLRTALDPFIHSQGFRLNKPHGESREIDAETWAEHGQALRDALAYAGSKHAKQTT